VVFRPAQPSIPPESANEDQLRLGRQNRHGPFVDKRMGMSVELYDSLTKRAIPGRFCDEVDS